MKKRPSFTKGVQTRSRAVDGAWRQGRRRSRSRTWQRRNQLYKWQEQLSVKGKADAFPGHGRRAGSEAEVARLKRELARLEEENTILKSRCSTTASACTKRSTTSVRCGMKSNVLFLKHVSVERGMAHSVPQFRGNIEHR